MRESCLVELGSGELSLCSALKTKKETLPHSSPERACVPAADVVPTPIPPIRPGPTQKSAESFRLQPQGWGLQEVGFFRASNQCLQRLICFCFCRGKLKGWKEARGHQSIAREHEPGDNAASQTCSKAHTAWLQGTVQFYVYPPQMSRHA